jgi:hypothetical protein
MPEVLPQSGLSDFITGRDTAPSAADETSAVYFAMTPVS